MSGQIQGFYSQIEAILQIPIATATLPYPRQLESTLLSQNPGQIGSTTGNYANVYNVVPAPQNASPAVRDMIDMTDAVAQDAMERSIAIDAIADQELSAADQINTNVQSAAPGTAPMIEAQADAWLIRANAYTQAALADLMRVRAIDLANNGANLKLGSGWAVLTQQNVTTTLQHQIAMFYFQQLFNTAMTGIDSGGATSGAVQVAQYILLASLLFGSTRLGLAAETHTSWEQRRFDSSR